VIEPVMSLPPSSRTKDEDRSAILLALK